MDLRNITDAELFGALDLSRDGLEAVSAAVERGDFPGAYSAWGDYLASSRLPRWYVDVDTYVVGMREAFPRLLDVIVAEADVVCAGNGAIFRDLSLPIIDGVPDLRGDGIDDDNLISLQNLNQMYPLTYAWLITGEKDYVDRVLSFVRAMYAQRNEISDYNNFDGHFWRSELNVGLKLFHLAELYCVLRNYSGITAKDHEVILKFLLAFSELTADYERNQCHVDAPNQKLVAMCALASTGAAFPEFANAEEWRTIGRHRTVEILHETVYPDGAHSELCSQYHMTVSRDIGKMSRVLEINGFDGLFAGGLGAKRFRAVHDWMVATVAPDGFHPAYHSGVYCTEWLAYVMAYQALSPTAAYADIVRKWYTTDYVPAAKAGPGDMLYYLTPDLKPDLAAAPSAATDVGIDAINLTPSQTCVVRCGDGDDAVYFSTLNGTPRRGHGYPQLGSFIYYANGRHLVLHPGSPHSYCDPNYETYFHTTFSHNTVIVDEENQDMFLRSTREIGGRCEAWHHNRQAAVLRVYNPAYTKNQNVRHTRTFVFVDPGWLFIHDRLWPTEGAEPQAHTYDWALHTSVDLAEGDGRMLEAAGMLRVLPAYPDEIESIRSQPRPAILPLAYQPDMSSQLGTANEYYLRKTSAPGAAVTYGVLLQPVTNGAPVPRLRLLDVETRRESKEPVSDRTQFEGFAIEFGGGGRYTIMIRNEGIYPNAAVDGIYSSAAVMVNRYDGDRLQWTLEAGSSL